MSAALATLRQWDFKWSANSIPTTLAVTWGDELDRIEKASGVKDDEFFAKATPTQTLDAFGAAIEHLERDFDRGRSHGVTSIGISVVAAM